MESLASVSRTICDVVGIHLLGEMESHSSNISNLRFSISPPLHGYCSGNEMS